MASSISTEQLQEIKDTLENSINNSSESSDLSDSTYTSNSSTSSGFKKKRRIKSKLEHTQKYKTKCNNLESRLRYMQLEMVNNELKINELTHKISESVKYDTLFNKTNFLFERLDNAIKVLIERVNTIEDDSIIKFKYINSLDAIKISCDKVKEKYAVFLVTDIYPLLNDNQIYLKNSITALYDIKQKELNDVSKLIDTNIYNIKYSNTCWLSLFILFFIVILQIIIFVVYYYFK